MLVETYPGGLMKLTGLRSCLGILWKSCLTSDSNLWVDELFLPLAGSGGRLSSAARDSSLCD